MKHITSIDIKPKTDLDKLKSAYASVFEQLEHIGLTISQKKGKIELIFDQDQYNSIVLRGAGRKRVEFMTEQGDKIKCIDIVSMLKTMPDYEIMEKIGMKKATYYRHKKAMMESDWYKQYFQDLELVDKTIYDYIAKQSPVF